MTKTGWATLVAVAIPIAALFGPVLVSDRSFAMRDAAHFYHPLFEWCAREWGAGRVPLWNPYENCGIPVLADATSSLFYPGKLLFLLPIDFVWRYKLYVVLHVVLAAANSYWLARAWKASACGAAIAAIAYSCGGNVVFQYCNIVFLVGAAWLPLAALSADRMLRERSWRAALGLGAVLALMILGGDPQAAYHGLLITALYALVLACSTNPDTSRSLRERCRGLTLQLGLTGLAAAVGFLLAAVQILPSSEATKYSERAAFDRPRNIYEAAQFVLHPVGNQKPGESRTAAISGGFFGTTSEGTHQDLVFDFSVGPWRLAEYIWPNIGGRMFPTNRRWFSLLPFEGRTWTPTLYLGLFPLLLALGAWRLRGGEPRERWLSWLVLIFTLATFGWYGPGWIAGEVYALLHRSDGAKLGVAPPVGGVYWLMTTLLPTYIYFRYPAKLLPLVALGLSQLAARGWDRAVAEPRPRLAHVLQTLGMASGAAAFAIWCVGSTFGMFPKSLPADNALGPFDRTGAYADILLALVQTAVVALAGLWILRRVWNEPARANQWQAALVLLTAAELAVANAWLVSSAPAAVWRNESQTAQAIRKASAGSPAEAPLPPRVYRGDLAGWRPRSFREHGSPGRSAEAAQWEHDTLFPKYHLASGLSLIDSYGSIKLLDYDSLLLIAKSRSAPLDDKRRLPHAAALRLLGTEHLLLPESSQPKFAVPESPVGASGWPEDTVLWRVQRTQPRAWIVHEVTTLPPLPRPAGLAATDARSGEVLFLDNKARDFRHVAVVETDQPLAEWSAPTVTAGDDAEEPCRFTHYDPQRVVIETKLAQPGLLVLSDIWYPGWQATVTTAGQSRSVPIYQTNRVLRGVWLPAGKHQIEYRFQPQSFVRGAWISGVSWLLLGLLGIAASRVHKRSAMHHAR